MEVILLTWIPFYDHAQDSNQESVSVTTEETEQISCMYLILRMVKLDLLKYRKNKYCLTCICASCKINFLKGLYMVIMTY